MSLRKDNVGRTSDYHVCEGTMVVSRSDLAHAIQRSFTARRGEGSMDGTVAMEMADHVLNFFGYGERIIDNMLRTDDRDIFYMLEDLGILKTEREETTLYDGREWRINYWTMKKHYIETLVGDKCFNSSVPDIQEEDPYRDLPENFWKRE